MYCFISFKKTTRENEEQFPDALKNVERNIHIDYLYFRQIHSKVLKKYCRELEMFSLK